MKADLSPPVSTPDLAETLAYLAGLREFAPPPNPDAAPRRTDRDRFRSLLQRIGDPQNRLRCLHIAGTNGKGSTTTFLASALREAGYTVGAYLSPFVWDVRERWQVWRPGGGEGDALIPAAELVRQVAELRPHVDALAAEGIGQITEFELKTAVAFRWFAEQAVDFAVIEVGIGGRLDSTNVIPAPLASVITSIGWDHQTLLGDTLAKIAAEKAGIIKRGSLVCVTAVSDTEPLAVICARADADGVPLVTIGDTEVAEAAGFDLRLRGGFQHKNAACAAAVLRTLHGAGVANISEDVLRRGLSRATLPGRFAVHRAPGLPPVVRDVAHNADAAKVLADALLGEFGAGKWATLICGMSRGHAPLPFLEALAPLTRQVIATAPAFRPQPPDDIVAAALQLNLPARVTRNVAEALKEGIALAVKQGDGSAPDATGDGRVGKGDGGYVVVTGSFYTVGESGANDLQK